MNTDAPTSFWPAGIQPGAWLQCVECDLKEEARPYRKCFSVGKVYRVLAASPYRGPRGQTLTFEDDQGNETMVALGAYSHGVWRVHPGPEATVDALADAIMPSGVEPPDALAAARAVLPLGQTAPEGAR